MEATVYAASSNGSPEINAAAAPRAAIAPMNHSERRSFATSFW